MAIASLGELTLSSNGNKTAAASIAVTTTATPAVGDLVVIQCGRDDVANDTVPDTFTDTHGNTWNKVSATRLATVGTALDGVVAVLFWSKITTAFSGTTTLTWSWTGNATAKSIRAFRYSGVDTIDGTPGTNNAASTAVSASVTPSAAGALVIGFAAREGAAGASASNDTDTTNGTWSATSRSSLTTGGTAATNCSTLYAQKIVTASGAQTFNSTIGTSTDWAAIAVAFSEAYVAPVDHPITASGSTTTNGTADIRIAGEFETLIDEGFESGSTPWSFTAEGVSNGSVTLETSGAAEGSRFITCATTGTSAQFARMQKTIALDAGDTISTSFWVKLPSNFETNMTAAVQIAGHDPFPTTNNHTRIIIFNGDKLARVYTKTNGTDTILTGTWAIPLNQWVHIRWDQKISTGSDGYVKVWQDGVLVASGTGANLYDTGGNGVTRFRYGMVATGDATQTNALSLGLDRVELYDGAPPEPALPITASGSTTTDGSAAIGIESGGGTSYSITASGSTVTDGSADIRGAAAFDDFNRANGGVGANYTTMSGRTGAQIVSNEVEASTASTNYTSNWTTDGVLTDCFAEADARLTSTAYNSAKVGVRASNSARTYYIITWDTGSSGLYRLDRVVNGTFTQLGSSITGVGITGTRRLRIEAEGTTIRGLVDGVEQFSETDSAIASGYPSIEVTRSGSGTQAYLDNFRTGVLSSGPVSYAITASGSTTTDGTASISATRVLSASGSTTTDGSAAIRATRVLTASGSTTTDGSAAVRATRALTASGAATTDGAAAIGLSVGGVSYSLTASGAATTDGAAVIRSTRALSASGAAATDGSATIRCTRVLSASGSTTTDGSAAIRCSRVLSASGTTTTNGTAGLGAIRPTSASGTAVTDGSAAIEIQGPGATSYPIAASGTTTTDGSAVIRCTRRLAASGSTATGGTAVIRCTRGVSASGSTATDGSAAIRCTRRVSASGATTTNGSASIQIPSVSALLFLGSSPAEARLGSTLVSLRL